MSALIVIGLTDRPNSNYLKLSDGVEEWEESLLDLYLNSDATAFIHEDGRVASLPEVGMLHRGPEFYRAEE